jgi:hypothetical protein
MSKRPSRAELLSVACIPVSRDWSMMRSTIAKESGTYNQASWNFTSLIKLREWNCFHQAIMGGSDQRKRGFSLDAQSERGNNSWIGSYSN